VAYREGFSGLQGLQRLTGPERKNLATKCPIVLLLLAGFFVYIWDKIDREVD
jgi:hypothetical protein